MDRVKPSDGTDLIWIVVAFSGVLAAGTAFGVAAGGFAWGLPGATHIQSYHPDEQNITYSLRNMRPRQLDFNPKFFGNPTFYTYQVGTLAFAAGMAGILPLETSEDYWLTHPNYVRRFYILGRGLSFAYAIGAVALVYLLGRRVTQTSRGGLVAAAVFASLPVTAIHSHYMTVNASAVFWSLAAMLFVVRIVDAPSWRNYAAAGVCAGLAISTKLNNAFLPLGILVAGWVAQRKAEEKARWLPGKFWLAAGLCAAAFFAGSPYYILSYGSVVGDPHHRMNIAALLSLPVEWRTALGDFWNHITAACGWGFAAVLPLSIIASCFIRNRRAAPLLAVGIPFLLLAVKSGWWAFPSRLWPLLAVSAVLVAALVEGKFRPVARFISAAAVIAALLVTILWNNAYAKLMHEEHVRAESSRWIIDNVPPGSRIAILDTPYYEEPDIVYENALHEGALAQAKYAIVNLHGDFGALGQTDCEWLVVPGRFDAQLREKTAKGIAEYARGNRYFPRGRFERDFEFLGWRLRDWIPADMVQDYPVYIFSRTPDGFNEFYGLPETPEEPDNSPQGGH